MNITRRTYVAVVCVFVVAVVSGVSFWRKSLPTVVDCEKILVLGSAPYMKDWVAEHLEWFVDRGYRIVACNNAWKLVSDLSWIEWHTAENFDTAGTFVPTAQEIRRMKSVKIHLGSEREIYHRLGCPHYTDSYLDYKTGTMFLNIVYYFLHEHTSPSFEMVVVGFDMVYNKDGDTFYTSPKARNDPLLLWGREGLNAELRNSWDVFQKRNVRIRNASLQSETSLPYPRFTEYLSTTSTSTNTRASS